MPCESFTTVETKALENVNTLSAALEDIRRKIDLSEFFQVVDDPCDRHIKILDFEDSKFEGKLAAIHQLATELLQIHKGNEKLINISGSVLHALTHSRIGNIPYSILFIAAHSLPPKSAIITAIGDEHDSDVYLVYKNTNGKVKSDTRQCLFDETPDCMNEMAEQVPTGYTNYDVDMPEDSDFECTEVTKN